MAGVNLVRRLHDRLLSPDFASFRPPRLPVDFTYRPDPSFHPVDSSAFPAHDWNSIHINPVLPVLPEAALIRRIVIIDDEPAFGEMVAGVAAACGYEACFTTGPERFKAEVAALDPALIMLDLSMPGTDGIELLRHLGATGSGARIVIASGFDRRVTETAVNLGRELGLAMLPPLAKPLRIEELRELLSTHGEEAKSA